MRGLAGFLATVAIVLASARAGAQQWAPQPPSAAPPGYGPRFGPAPYPAPSAPPQYPPTSPPPPYPPPSAALPYRPPGPGSAPYGSPYPAPGSPAHAPFGVTLPPPSPPTAAMIATVKQLDQAKLDDSGRRLTWVWIDARGGFEQLGMQAFSGNPGAGFLKTSSSGGVVDGRGRSSSSSRCCCAGASASSTAGSSTASARSWASTCCQVRVEPHVALGVGYAGMGGLHETVVLDSTAASALSLRGFYARLDAGVRLLPRRRPSPSGSTPLAELLGLFRPALTTAEVGLITATPGLSSSLAASAPLLLQAGTGWGGTIALTGVAALHF